MLNSIRPFLQKCVYTIFLSDTSSCERNYHKFADECTEKNLLFQLSLTTLKGQHHLKIETGYHIPA